MESFSVKSLVSGNFSRQLVKATFQVLSYFQSMFVHIRITWYCFLLLAKKNQNIQFYGIQLPYKYRLAGFRICLGKSGVSKNNPFLLNL